MKPTVMRREFAIAKAKRLLKEMGLMGPPALAEEVAEHLGIVYDYHISEVINYSVCFKINGEYYISVALSGVEGRDNWSGIHEISHVYLGHYDTYEVDNLQENVLTVHERWILDREADIFAREFLMPKAWVRQAVELPLDARQVGELKDLFMVSWKAIIIRLEELGIANRKDIFRLFKKNPV